MVNCINQVGIVIVIDGIEIVGNVESGQMLVQQCQKFWVFYNVVIDKNGLWIEDMDEVIKVMVQVIEEFGDQMLINWVVGVIVVENQFVCYVIQWCVNMLCIVMVQYLQSVVFIY